MYYFDFLSYSMIAELVQAQHNFFESNQTKDLDFRIKQLKKFGKVLIEHEEMLYDAIYADFKKSRFDTYSGELGILQDEIKFACKKLKKWTRRKNVRTNRVNLNWIIKYRNLIKSGWFLIESTAFLLCIISIFYLIV